MTERKKSLLRRIAGDRPVSQPAMVLALTWFGAAAFVMARHFWWGVAMAALPCLLFALSGAGRRYRRVLVSAAACLLVLVAMDSGLAQPSRSPEPHAIAPVAATITSPAEATSAATGISAASATDGLAGEASPAAELRIVASSRGEVYHLPGCASAKRIKPENLVAYSSLEEAKAAGLRPCKKCKPDEAAGKAPSPTNAPGGQP